MAQPQSPMPASGKIEYVYQATEKIWDDEKVSSAILARLPKVGCSVLEVGCGTGHLARRMAQLGHRVVALDSSSSGIELAKRTPSPVQYYETSALDDFRPFASSLEVIVAMEVIEHLPAPKRFLKNAFQTLEPGGSLLLTTPYHGYFKNLALSLFNRWDAHFGVDWDGGHIKFFSRKALAHMLESVGFHVCYFESIGRVPLLAKSMLMEAKKPKA